MICLLFDALFQTIPRLRLFCQARVISTLTLVLNVSFCKESERPADNVDKPA